MEEKISILIPMYNSEKFIGKCLKSILKQTYKNFEVIIIDDGSTDKSLENCKKIVEDDKRFQIYSRENKGVAYTRNELIKKSNCKYVAFIDSDDYIDSDYIEILYKTLKKYDADIVSCSLYIYNNTTKSKIKSYKDYMVEKEEALKKLLYQYEINNGINCKLCKKELFNYISFPIGKIYEDLATIYRLINSCKKVAITSYQGYNYYYNNTGITKSKFKEADIALLEYGEEIFKFINENYGQDLELANKNSLVSQCVLLAIKIPINNKYKNEIYKIKKYIKMYRKELLKNKETYPRLKIFLISSFFGLRAIKLTDKLINMYKKIFKNRG